ncbi:plasma membrane fusion protein [Perilla frutescens var. hirtella]|uniref:Plasma membrane fusion protein n=1 Tax=Perilla frutescens var. hirtella TaxID=608512 RepID=A0AAD4J802_PERFH|nr:plasma membrane fusion protein [Perilla frutescens var. hirtella]
MSPSLIASLIPAAAPPPLKSPHSPPPQHSQPEISTISRRSAAVLLSSLIIPIIQPPLASAFSLGISGPKEWLKEQKKKSAKFLLAPVDASRNILQSAYILLMKNEAEFGEDDLDEVQKLFVSAARDCVPQDRNSFVEFQSNTGVEVCTFKLIVKNAASLLDDKDPLKLEAESKLSDLIRSFSSLSGMAREGGVELTLNSRQRVADALKDTISSLNNFEQGIKDCLQV